MTDIAEEIFAPQDEPGAGLREALSEIRRVIVGPCRQQNENLNKARLLLGDDVKLVPSETPFLPLP